MLPEDEDGEDVAQDAQPPTQGESHTLQVEGSQESRVWVTALLSTV